MLAETCCWAAVRLLRRIVKAPQISIDILLSRKMSAFFELTLLLLLPFKAHKRNIWYRCLTRLKQKKHEILKTKIGFWKHPKLHFQNSLLHDQCNEIRSNAMQVKAMHLQNTCGCLCSLYPKFAPNAEHVSFNLCYLIYTTCAAISTSPPCVSGKYLFWFFKIHPIYMGKSTYLTVSVTKI